VDVGLLCVGMGVGASMPFFRGICCEFAVHAWAGGVIRMFVCCTVARRMVMSLASTAGAAVLYAPPAPMEPWCDLVWAVAGVVCVAELSCGVVVGGTSDVLASEWERSWYCGLWRQLPYMHMC